MKIRIIAKITVICSIVLCLFDLSCFALEKGQTEEDKKQPSETPPPSGEDKAPPKTLWTRIRALFRRPTLRALAGSLLVLVLLVAVNELPHAGKLTLQPFKTFGFSEEDGELGERMAQEIYYNLAVFRRQFQPAWGRNKKEAEQRAARNALSELNNEPPPFPTD